MSVHRIVPVTRGLDDEDGPQAWRCLGCGAVRSYRDELEDVDASCPALAWMFDEVAS